MLNDLIKLEKAWRQDSKWIEAADELAALIDKHTPKPKKLVPKANPAPVAPVEINNPGLDTLARHGRNGGRHHLSKS